MFKALGSNDPKQNTIWLFSQNTVRESNSLLSCHCPQTFSKNCHYCTIENSSICKSKERQIQKTLKNKIILSLRSLLPHAQRYLNTINLTQLVVIHTQILYPVLMQPENKKPFDLKLQEFREEHIPQYVEYAYDSYMETNPSFRKANISREDFNSQCLKVLPSLIRAAEVVNAKRKTKTLFNHFYRIDGKMILAGFTTEIHHFFKVLIKSSLQPLKAYFIPVELALKVPENTGVFMQRLAIRKEYLSSGLLQYFQLQQFLMFRSEGFEIASMILINPRTLSHYTKAKKGLEVNGLKYIENGKEVDFVYVTIKLHQKVPYDLSVHAIQSKVCQINNK